MEIYILTLFPEMVTDALSHSIVGRAAASGKLRIHALNIRDYSTDAHKKVDDYPYGGGAGMVMFCQPIYDCVNAAKEMSGGDAPVIYMSPQGERFDQGIAKELSGNQSIILLCGHYEGIDERVIEEVVDRQISIGDYVLTGGELAAMVVADAVARLVPGVLHNDQSAAGESFENDLLEYPPEILLSGDHAKVDAWRYEQSVERTKRLRPDLLREG